VSVASSTKPSPPDVEGAPGWVMEHAERPGPFLTRVTWRRPDGTLETWSSRVARKRAALDGRAAAPDVARRQRIINTIAAAAFTTGGSLSSPRYERWRWWSWEPDRIEWVSAVILFGGTVAFGINLLDSFLQGLTVKQQNRLIWAPDTVGCAIFLISGHLALVGSATAASASGETSSAGGSPRSTSSGHASSSYPRWRLSSIPRPRARSTRSSQIGVRSGARSASRLEACSKPSSARTRVSTFRSTSSHALARTLADDIAEACGTLKQKGGLHESQRKRAKTGTGY
jgi:hypothetical protein